MIEIETTRRNYDGDASNDTFVYDFRVDDVAWLYVYVDAVLQVEGTDYTVTGIGEDEGGSVVFTSGNIPPVGEANVILFRLTPAQQLVDLPENGAFSSEIIERDALDKLMMLIQEIRNRFGIATPGGFLQWDEFGFIQVGDPSGASETGVTSVTENALFVDITFDEVANDDDYRMDINTNWVTSWGFPTAEYLTTGCRINFNVAAPSGASVRWARYNAV